MKPIWKDNDYMIYNVTEQLQYNINLYTWDGTLVETLYTGIAKPKPNEKTIKIRISDYAKNLCNSDAEHIFDEDYTVLGMENYCKCVGVRYEQNGITKQYVSDYYNSYDYNNTVDFSDTEVNPISAPITSYSNRGWVLISIVNGRNTESIIEIAHPNGNKYYYGNIPVRSAIMIQVKDLSVGNYIVFADGEECMNFKVEEKCNRYNLHYINAMGGYDTLPIEGMKDKRSDDFTFDYFKAHANNQNILKPQTNKFKVDITPRWSLQTGFLNDEQSAKMYNLFGSQRVWLEDTTTGEIHPVYITDKAVDYKTYTNNGKRKISYTINVTSSNTIVKL